MLKRLAIGAGAASGWGSAVAGTLSWATAISEVTSDLLGVPLPVVLAAIAGALLSRSYADTSIPYLRAILVTAIWTIAGCVSAPIAMTLAENSGYRMPTSALSFLALLITAMAPRLYPIVADAGADLVRTWIGKLKGGQPNAPK